MKTMAKRTKHKPDSEIALEMIKRHLEICEEQAGPFTAIQPFVIRVLCEKGLRKS